MPTASDRSSLRDRGLGQVRRLRRIAAGSAAGLVLGFSVLAAATTHTSSSGATTSQTAATGTTSASTSSASSATSTGSSSSGSGSAPTPSSQSAQVTSGGS